jgi:hypothetical protein
MADHDTTGAAVAALALVDHHVHRLTGPGTAGNRPGSRRVQPVSILQ